MILDKVVRVGLFEEPKNAVSKEVTQIFGEEKNVACKFIQAFFGTVA